VIIGDEAVTPQEAQGRIAEPGELRAYPPLKAVPELLLGHRCSHWQSDDRSSTAFGSRATVWECRILVAECVGPKRSISLAPIAPSRAAPRRPDRRLASGRRVSWHRGRVQLTAL